MDLFEYTTPSQDQPLAEQLRPAEFEDFLGQDEVVGKNSPIIKNIVKHKRVPNIILWGPPGCGKTTFANILKQIVPESEFIQVNAVDTGAKRLKEIGQQARDRKLHFNRGTILFVDEIHRFNRAQQDVLLPFTERGDFSLVGATTENPSYELNAALLSRSKVLVFKALSSQSLNTMLNRASEHLGIELTKMLSNEAFEFLIEQSDGDGRKVLNTFEQVAQLYLSSQPDTPFTSADIVDILKTNSFYYDKKGDEHYNCVSAFIKSIRGSDPDASLYYLARMLKGGEDPVFIARRLVILASEDVGNGDPRALTLAVSGLQAVELIGLPEAAINLAHVTTYLASAPKSNRAYMGLRKAQELVERTGHLPVPLALRSSQTKLAKSLGFGKDYKYSHDSAKGYIPQTFLPEEIATEKLYEPLNRGFEKNIIQYLDWLKDKEN